MQEMRMQGVIVLGKGDLGIRVADWFLKSSDYKLQAVVPVIPEPSWTSSFQSWARANNIPIVETGHYRDIESASQEDWNVDLAVSIFYDKIIKEWFIKKCKRILNLHNGPLPKYRGYSPINWALKNNEIEHGITIHEITPGIDDGPVISQLKYSIYPEFDEVIDVYKRSIEYGWTLFQQTMPLLPKIEARQQVHSEASYYCSAQNHLLEERRFFRKEDSLASKNSSH
jgi:methionyl-tRNA formyltransferase